MNWLAHLLLAEPDVESWIGAVAADWVKGEARTRFSAGVQRGFALHRTVDMYTDSHATVLRSQARIVAPYRRYAGVLIDIFYDYFLSARWGEYCPQPREEFIASVYTALAEHEPHLPPEVARGFAYMRRDDWLGSYATVDGIALTLRRLSHRLRPGNLLAEGAAQIEIHMDALDADFCEFFPQMRAHVTSW
ncbi:MAG: ACP phosphodiesterase [Chloroflexi bacterium]|nr:ACP phosphodiesterase [Chloroflexota bacterium]